MKLKTNTKKRRKKVRTYFLKNDTLGKSTIAMDLEENKKGTLHFFCKVPFSGEGGIRTPGRVSPTTV